MRKGMCWVMRLGVAVFCTIALLGASACKKEEKKGTERTVNVLVATAKTESRQPSLDVVGALEAIEEVTISAETEGIIRKIAVTEGKKINKGAEIAVIDETNYRLAVMQAEAGHGQALANQKNAATEYKRREALFREQLVTRQDFDNIRTKYALSVQEAKRAKSVLDLSRRQLQKCRVLSPLNGFVKTKMASAGDFVRGGVPLCVIINTNTLKMAFSVPEGAAGRIRAGQKVAFNVDAFPDKRFVGVVSTLGAHVDEKTRTLRVEALVDNRDHMLKPGYFSKATVYVEKMKDVVLIPANTVIYDGDITRVFVVGNGSTALPKKIVTGDKYGEMVEVISGITVGEEVIVTGQNNLVEGVRVNVAR